MSRLGVLPAGMVLCATVVVSTTQSGRYTVYVTNERSQTVSVITLRRTA